MECDVLVIGGGPIGSAVARDIAKSGYKVIVLEEDIEIGKPINCAGIVSPKLIPLTNVSEEIILSKLNRAYIYTKSGKKILIGDSKIRAVAIDRERFDKLLAEQAMNSGVKYIINAKAIGIDDRVKYTSNVLKNKINKNYTFKNNITKSDIVKNRINEDSITIKFLRNNKEEKIKAKLLIGADGVNSDVAKWFDFERPKEIINALTFDINLDIFDENSVNIIASRSYSPGFFAWIIPINNKRVRFGMGISSNSNRSLKYYFNKFRNIDLKPFSYMFNNLKKNNNDNKISVGKIPLGLNKKTYGNKVMIVGDAACQVKPLTGGGLFYGLICAKRCIQVAIEALRSENFSESFLSKYQRLWMKDIGLEIEQGFILRDIFLSLNDGEIDELFDIFIQEDFLNIINKYGDIDYPWKLALRIITKKPYILRYLKKFLIDSKLNPPSKPS